MSTEREFLRHTLATLAYRAGKALRNAPESFADFQVAPGTRTPGQILAHMCDLADWALTQATGRELWQDTSVLTWNDGVARFHKALTDLDEFLAGEEPIQKPAAMLFQGAIADALTHTGQINMLRRIAGSPVRGENYARAHITKGQVGTVQPEPVREFD